MPFRGPRSLPTLRSTCKPAVGEKGEGEGDCGDEQGVEGHLAVESLELQESLGSESVIEQLIDEVVVFPVGEVHVRGVAPQIGDLIAILVDHL